MPVDTEGLTIPQAIRQIFGVDVAKESPLLKNKANSFVRNGLITVRTENKVHRKAVYLCADQRVPLHNALILNAIFSDPKDVKKIFEDNACRVECAKTVRMFLSNRQSILGQAFESKLATELADCLENAEIDLRKELLPNPFSVLPQAALGNNTTLLHALLAQAAALEPADSFLLAYLNGDWDKAQKLSSDIDSDSSAILLLKSEIDRKIQEAKEFSELLGLFRKK